MHFLLLEFPSWCLHLCSGSVSEQLTEVAPFISPQQVSSEICSMDTISGTRFAFRNYLWTLHTDVTLVVFLPNANKVSNVCRWKLSSQQTPQKKYPCVRMFVPNLNVASIASCPSALVSPGGGATPSPTLVRIRVGGRAVDGIWKHCERCIHAGVSQLFRKNS